MVSALNAGELRQRVSLQSYTETRTKGVLSKEAATYADSVYAKVEPLSGREFWQAQQVNSQVNWKVTLRYRDDVRAQHRVLYGTRVLEITTVMPDESRKEFVVLLCREMNG